MIELQNINLKINKKTILTDINFTISNNVIHSIIGPNGSGKTSLFNLLTGRYRYQKNIGSIKINSKEFSENEDYIFSKISFAPDIDKIDLNLTGREFLNFNNLLNKAAFFEKKINLLLEIFNLQNDIDRPVLEYSHGMLKKIQLISALSSSASYLLLDEPFNGIDYEYVSVLKEILIMLKEKKTLVISSHNLNIVEEISDEITILKEGKIQISASKKEVFKKFNTNNISKDWLKILNIKTKDSEIFKEFLDII